MPNRLSVFLASLCLGASFLLGCRSPTQISVEVSTNVACTDWQGTAIAVGELGPALEESPATTTSTFCNDAGYLGTVVAIPSGSESEAVAFRVVGAVGESLEECTTDAASSGCIVARRALNFIPHTPLTLSVPLKAACAGIICDPTTTCVDGVCRPAAIPDPGACANATCGEGALGDGGSAPDATLDGGVGSDGGQESGSPSDAGSVDGMAPDATVRDAGGEDAEASPPGLDAQSPGCGENCALALGERFSCIARAGGVVCWGRNDRGELGSGSFTNPGAPGPVLVQSGGALDGTQGLVSGFDTACAFLAGGGVSCWGPTAPIVDAGEPYATPQPNFAGASSLSIAQFHLCWQDSAAISCASAGQDDLGSFGNVEDAGATEVVVATVPPPDASAGPFVQLSTSQYFTCVLDTSGRVFCIGSNESNEVDTSTTSSKGILTSFVNVAIPNGQPALELALMDQTGCARTLGHVFCWGNEFAADSRGGGNGINEPNEVLLDDGGAIDALRLAPGEYHSCALLVTGQVVCWGDNQFHELGRGEPVTADAGPSDVARLVLFPDGGVFGGATGLASGGYHTCATTSDGSLWCWGDNRSGETAPGDTVSRSSPTQVSY